MSHAPYRTSKGPPKGGEGGRHVDPSLHAHPGGDPPDAGARRLPRPPGAAAAPGHELPGEPQQRAALRLGHRGRRGQRVQDRRELLVAQRHSESSGIEVTGGDTGDLCIYNIYDIIYT